MIRKKTTLPLIALAAILIAALWFISYRTFSLEFVKNAAESSMAYAAEAPLIVGMIVLLTQIIGMLLSLPTKGVATILAGALLGPWFGSGVTLAGVLIGTSGLFFGTRLLFRRSAMEKFGAKAELLEKRITRHPILTVAGLRMIITIPYGPITIAAALSRMEYRHFLLGSALGDAPVVVFYAIAGERLATLTSTTEAIPISTVIILAAAGVALFAGSVVGKVKGRS